MALLKLKVRRGTKAELTAYGALDTGELGFTEDEKRLYVGDGVTLSNFLIGRVEAGDGAPSGALVAGTMYVDQNSTKLYYCDGTEWSEVSTVDLSGYQPLLTSTSTLGDLGLAAPDPAYSGMLAGITASSTLAELLAAIDAYTPS